MADTDLNSDFKRAQARYADGELVMLIDGSGGMPAAYDAENCNAFTIAVDYGVEAKALNKRVSGYTFGEFEAQPPLPLDGKEDPMRYCPCGPSYFMPAFQAVVKDYEEGRIGKPAHFIIVSDGEVYEGPNQTVPPPPLIKDAITDFLRAHPEVMFDMIVPGDVRSDLVKMTKEIAAAVPENPPRLFVVHSADMLKKSIADVINERSGTSLDQVAEKAMSGIDNATAMRTLRFRKPPESVS